MILNGTKPSTNIQLMGNFSGDVTVTRIGVPSQIQYQYSPLLKVKMVVQMSMSDSVKTLSNCMKMYSTLQLQLMLGSLITQKPYVLLLVMAFAWS